MGSVTTDENTPRIYNLVEESRKRLARWAETVPWGKWVEWQKERDRAEHRYGRFTVAQDCAGTDLFSLILEKMHFNPKRIGPSFEPMTVEYVGFSSLFAVCHSQCSIPTYCVSATEVRDEYGKIVDVSVTVSGPDGYSITM